jgi:ribosome recycling factor
MDLRVKEINETIEEGQMYMDEAIEHLQKELHKIRTGKASPDILSGLYVNYYGSSTPLKQVANVGVTDAKTLSIQPWDKKMLAVIEKAIFEANLGLTPMNDGETIRINIPPLTEDRRKQLVKHAKALGEESKVSLRNTRHKLMDSIKKAVKNGVPEDAGKRKEEQVEKLIHQYYEQIEELIKAKDKDIMTI